MRQLRNRVAVVTGAASGIGYALAARLATEGMQVALADVEEDALTVAVDSLVADGADVVGIPTDVADPEAVAELADAVVQRFGTVHLVCNNAGVSGMFGRSWVTPADEWRWVIGVNLWGVIHGIRAFVPILVEQGEGHIVNTGSGASWDAPPGMAPYSATKHAVLAISEALLRELRGMGSPVGVSVFCPSLVKTQILSSERNWPPGLPGGPVTDEAGTSAPMKSLFQQAMASAIEPAAAAGAVIEGVLADRFLISNAPDATIASAQRRVAVARGEAPSSWPP